MTCQPPRQSPPQGPPQALAGPIGKQKLQPPATGIACRSSCESVRGERQRRPAARAESALVPGSSELSPRRAPKVPGSSESADGARQLGKLGPGSDAKLGRQARAPGSGAKHGPGSGFGAVRCLSQVLPIAGAHGDAARRPVKWPPGRLSSGRCHDKWLPVLGTLSGLLRTAG